MYTKIVTAPPVEPVTTAEVKTFLRGISHSDHDTLLGTMIKAARQDVEKLIDQALVEQTRRTYYTDWPAGNKLYLPGSNIQSISSLKYVGTDDSVNTVSTDVYSLVNKNYEAYIALQYSQLWPTAVINTVEYPIYVDYVCGYAATEDSPVSYTDNIPEDLKLAVMLKVQMLYDQPTAANEKAIQDAYMWLLNNYRQLRV